MPNDSPIDRQNAVNPSGKYSAAEYDAGEVDVIKDRVRKRKEYQLILM